MSGALTGPARPPYPVPVKALVLAAAGFGLIGCGDRAPADALSPQPVVNDLVIQGFEHPRDLESGRCEFGAEPFVPADELTIRVPDDLFMWTSTPAQQPPAPASPHRSAAIRIRREGIETDGTSRPFRLTRATVRWECSERDNAYQRETWPRVGLEPDWSPHPLELEGLERPFCGPDLQVVQQFELPVAPVELGPGESATAWVEILSPTDRRRFSPYVDLYRLYPACGGEGEFTMERPFVEVNEYCRRMEEVRREHFPEDPPLGRRFEAHRYLLRLGKHGLKLRPNLTLYFEDSEGLEYQVAAELRLQLIFGDFQSYFSSYGGEFLPGHHCYERPWDEIGG